MRFLLPLALALAACSSDPTDQNPPPPQDAQPFDLAPDAADAQRVDVGDDRPGPMDAGADAGFDVGFEAALQELPAPDAGDSGTADVGSDVVVDGAGDAGTNVPEDVRINCAVPGAPDISCASNADCARCIPGAFNSIWCCARNGTCGNTSNPTCD